MTRWPKSRWMAALVVTGVVGATAAACRLGRANALTVGLLLFLVVLFASTRGGFRVGLYGAVLATACLNYFFLPPVGTFRVADPENWLALAAFVTAAAVASRLVASAREAALRAEDRAREIDALNALAIAFLGTAKDPVRLARLAIESLAGTRSRGSGVVLVQPDDLETLAWSGAPFPDDLRSRVLGGRASVQTVELGDGEERDVLVPLIARGEPIGALVSLGTRATRGAIESVGKLLSLALEREALLKERAAMEVVRQSESLKTALLGAVSHDLSTPMTAIGFQVDSLRRRLGGHEALETVEELDGNVNRLRRRIDDLLAVGRLEAGVLVPAAEPTPPADLFRAARENLPFLRRPIVTTIDPECPDVLVDPSLGLEVVVNLLENADRASPEGTTVELVARPDAGFVRLGILDRGRGIPDAPPGTTIDVATVTPQGLGLEIARRFAAASGGSVALESREGGGVAAWLRLPSAMQGAE